MFIGLNQSFPKERSDWEDWLNQDKETILNYNVELAALEAQSNTAVYNLFELSSEEIQYRVYDDFSAFGSKFSACW